MVANPQTNEGQRVPSGTAESRPSLSDAKTGGLGGERLANPGEPWRTMAISQPHVLTRPVGPHGSQWLLATVRLLVISRHFLQPRSVR